MSQADAELYIQEPILEISVATQTIVNVEFRKGLHGDGATAVECTVLTGVRRVAATTTHRERIPSGSR